MANKKPGELLFPTHSNLWPPETTEYVDRLILMETITQKAEHLVENAMKLVPHIYDDLGLTPAHIWRAANLSAPSIDTESVIVSLAAGRLVGLTPWNRLDVLLRSYRLDAPWFVQAVAQAVLKWNVLATTGVRDVAPFLELWRTAPYEEPPKSRIPTYPEPPGMMGSSTQYIDDRQHAEQNAGWRQPEFLNPRDVRIFVEYRVNQTDPANIVIQENVERKTVLRSVVAVEKKLGFYKWRQKSRKT